MKSSGAGRRLTEDQGKSAELLPEASGSGGPAGKTCRTVYKLFVGVLSLKDHDPAAAFTRRFFINWFREN